MDRENPEQIYLEPPPGCSLESYGDRMWCEDRIEDDWTEYVRADLVADLCEALSLALTGAEFVRPSTGGGGTWRCSACNSYGRGLGEIRHEPACPKAVLERMAKIRQSMSDDSLEQPA